MFNTNFYKEIKEAFGPEVDMNELFNPINGLQTVAEGSAAVENGAIVFNDEIGRFEATTDEEEDYQEAYDLNKKMVSVMYEKLDKEREEVKRQNV